jgi:hypothetical protein
MSPRERGERKEEENYIRRGEHKQYICGTAPRGLTKNQSSSGEKRKEHGGKIN